MRSFYRIKWIFIFTDENRIKSKVVFIKNVDSKIDHKGHGFNGSNEIFSIFNFYNYDASSWKDAYNELHISSQLASGVSFYNTSFRHLVGCMYSEAPFANNHNSNNPITSSKTS